MRLNQNGVGLIVLLAASACSDAGGVATTGSPVAPSVNAANPVAEPQAPAVTPQGQNDATRVPAVTPESPAPVPPPSQAPGAVAPVDPVDPMMPPVEPPTPPVVEPPAPAVQQIVYTMVNGVGVATSEAQVPNIGDNTLDSKIRSRWSSPGPGQWIQYDLGKAVSLESIDLSFYTVNDARVYSFEVHTGVTETALEKVYEGKSVAGDLFPKVIDLPGAQARYVRIVGHGNSDGAENWNSYREVVFHFDGNGKLPNAPPALPALPLVPLSEQGRTSDAVIDRIRSTFDLEGDNPYKSDNRLVFDALESKFVTRNGHGWRNEVKHKKSLRESLNQYRERFKAYVTPDLSPGVKTIIAQYHADTTDIITTVFLADTAEIEEGDGIVQNGVFDVYARIVLESNPDQQAVVPLGYISSGESFELIVENDHGSVTVSAFGNSRTIRAANSTGSFFKFGNYMQAQHPLTNDRVDDSDDWGDFYRDLGITRGIVTFRGVEYSRD